MIFAFLDVTLQLIYFPALDIFYIILCVHQIARTSLPPVDPYLNFEKSSWKNQVRRTVFLQATQAVKFKFEID